MHITLHTRAIRHIYRQNVTHWWDHWVCLRKLVNLLHISKDLFKPVILKAYWEQIKSITPVTYFLDLPLFCYWHIQLIGVCLSIPYATRFSNNILVISRGYTIENTLSKTLLTNFLENPFIYNSFWKVIVIRQLIL